MDEDKGEGGTVMATPSAVTEEIHFCKVLVPFGELGLYK